MPWYLEVLQCRNSFWVYNFNIKWFWGWWFCNQICKTHGIPSWYLRISQDTLWNQPARNMSKYLRLGWKFLCKKVLLFYSLLSQNNKMWVYYMHMILFYFRLQQYLENLKNNVVGQGRVTKVMIYFYNILYCIVCTSFSFFLTKNQQLYLIWLTAPLTFSIIRSRKGMLCLAIFYFKNDLY
jgi:hypothetical protein